MIKWNLEQVIEKHRLKPRQVETRAIELGYTYGRNSIYRLLKEDGPTNVNRDTLTAIIHALRDLTKEPISVADLLEYSE